MGPNQYYGGQFGSVYPNQPKQSFFRSRAGLITLAVLLLVVTAVLAGISTTLNKDTADNFMYNTFVENNPDASRELLSDKLQKKYSIERWAGDVEYYTSVYDNYSIDFKETKESEETPTYTLYTYNLVSSEENQNVQGWVNLKVEETENGKRVTEFRIDSLQ